MKKVELSEVLHEIEECFEIGEENKNRFQPLYQRLKSLPSAEASFEDGVIYVLARLVQMFDKPSMAKDIFEQTGIQYNFNIKHVDVSERKYIRKMLRSE